jgi:hypothetical protein
VRDPLLAFSTAQVWILNFLLVVGVFLLGMWVGSVRDRSEEPPARVEYVEVLDGDFQDVPLTMENSMGNTFKWTCDMHFTAERSIENTAECEATE